LSAPPHRGKIHRHAPIFFHTVEKSFPRYGKKQAKTFHTMEKLFAIFPHNGTTLAKMFHSVEKYLSRVGGIFHGVESCPTTVRAPRARQEESRTRSCPLCAARACGGFLADFGGAVAPK
jgi:hypothetical protein